MRARFHSEGKMLQRIVLLVLAVAIVPGCKKKTPDTAPPASPQAAAPARTSAAPAPAAPISEMGWTGVLNEEEFKKLHVLRTGAPPPHRGQDLVVGGQKAYLSLPKNAKAPLPGIVVIHEWWGL